MKYFVICRRGEAEVEPSVTCVRTQTHDNLFLFTFELLHSSCITVVLCPPSLHTIHADTHMHNKVLVGDSAF